MFTGRGCACSSLIALAIIAASGGSAPPWFETSSAPPVDGHVLDPLHLGAEPVAVEELDDGLVHRGPRSAPSGPSRSAGDPARRPGGASSAPRPARAPWWAPRARGWTGLCVATPACGPIQAGARSRRSSTGSSAAFSPLQSGAPITPSDSTISSFQGCTIVAATIPAVARLRDVHRTVVHEHIDTQLHTSRDLVERAVEVVVGHPDPVEPGRGGLVGASPRRWLVTWIQWPGVVPLADGLDRVRVRHAGRDVLVGVRLLDAVHDRVALQHRDAPVALLLVGQVDAVALARDPLEQVPVVVQGRVDVQRDLRHGFVQ